MPVDRDPTTLGVYFLDVGQGDCTVIIPPEGEGGPILFDCADAFVARCFMRAHDITDLHAVITSHLDIDHIRGVLPFLRDHFEQGRRVQRFHIGLDGRPDPASRRKLRELIAQAKIWDESPPHDGFSVEPVFRTRSHSTRIADGTDWTVDLVLPHYGDTLNLNTSSQDPNDASAVLRIERNGTVILVGGDAPLGSWERLTEDEREAQVLRAPHHGGEIRHLGKTWTDFGDLYDHVKPAVSVFSAGSHFKHQHPHPAHAEAARRGGGCRLLCTQVTPRCNLDPTEHRRIALEVGQGVEPAYRHLGMKGHPAQPRGHESPCAGTIVAWIDTTGDFTVVPESGGRHDTEVIDRMDGPACRGTGLATSKDDWAVLRTGRSPNASPDAREAARIIRERLVGVTSDPLDALFDD